MKMVLIMKVEMESNYGKWHLFSTDLFLLFMIEGTSQIQASIIGS